jgi:hypothetical protein
VKFLDRFEQFFERLVEGSIGRLFRNQIQPAEIERKLERAMTSHQLIGAGAPIVPNDFSVKLNPVDLTPFESYLPGLCRQMEMWLQGIVDERDLTTIDQIKVQIAGDDSVRRREIVVDAVNVDRPPTLAPAPKPVQPTELFRIERRPTGAQLLVLRFDGGPQAGQEFVIRKQSNSVGRALDNDLVLDSADVSRRHARLDYDGRTLTVTDLDSTNGTKVNGRPITSRTIALGDKVAFGASTAVVESVPE